MSSIAPKREGLSLSGYASPSGLQGVGFWPRAVARLIDFAVHGVIALGSGFFVAILAFFVAAATGQPSDALLNRLGESSVAGFVFSILGFIGYQMICEGLAGRSLGKLILSLVVVKEDGSPCTVWSAFIRSLAYFVDSLFFGFIGYMAMQRTSMQQRHGDAWAHTIVLYKNQLTARQVPGAGRFLLVLALAILADVAMIMMAFVVDFL